jgi:hypothetical protein
VALEPGTCGNELFSDEQIARLAKVPTLIFFGDYLPVPTGFSATTWQDRFDACSVYVRRIKAAGGQAELVHQKLPDRCAHCCHSRDNRSIPCARYVPSPTSPTVGELRARFWQRIRAFDRSSRQLRDAAPDTLTVLDQ